VVDLDPERRDTEKETVKKNKNTEFYQFHRGIPCEEKAKHPLFPILSVFTFLDLPFTPFPVSLSSFPILLYPVDLGRDG